MTKKIIIKYLKFLQNECLRHQNDKIISDDEINQLNIEIAKIDFNLNEENHNYPKFKRLGFLGGTSGKEFKEQENRKHRFLKLYNDLDASLFRIKSM
ncbi:hypothetical protein [Polaribacter sargassicola]|uniref:hypothetical protein n=1 Tax=Polaribacter sargassicola TaxID=2836891 RepID=UPI001F3C9C58|nr:hypothetical protein [Polaribacter sp. DS7-9]MCG1035168.1 hypothetical protein [Polaribacter sp. DS7-9]